MIMNALRTLILVIYYTVYASGWTTESLSLHHDASSIVQLPRGGDGSVYNLDDDAPLVIIIDVDNCLYSEQELLSSVGQGIESQIVRNTHLFGLLHFNLTSADCDELYKKYGSTIEGLRHTLPSHLVEETMNKFYSEVYDPIDFGCLLGIRAGLVKNEDDSKSRSGYDHGNALQKRRALAELLESISNIHPVYLASNSPKAHIIRVINSMGLRNIKLAGILSPDAEEDGSPTVYPTKSSPQQYYQQILSRHSPQSKRIVLLDDSLYNIRQASTVGIHGIHVNGKDRTLEEGLAEALGHILPNDNIPFDLKSSLSKYTFSDVKYLGAKNKVDANAIDTTVWKVLAKELALRLQTTKNGTLRVADLGAGMLSMLELFMNGGGDNEQLKASMLSLIRNILGSSGNSGKLTELEYFAYESNSNLLGGCKEKLRKLGFQAVTGNKWQASLPEMKVTVHLLTKDFQNEQNPPESLDLIMGCCFADLFEPDQLVLSLQRFAHKSSLSPLVYLPITFAGGTRFKTTHPVTENEKSNRLVPSDTTAFQMYAQSLMTHGHNLDHSRIVNAMCNFGGSLIAKGSSDWIIHPKENHYLWETMMYFFGLSGASEITKNGFDAAGWIRRSRRDARTIIASNVDLLFHLVDSSSTQESEMNSVGKNAECDNTSRVPVEEIQFVSPYNVTTVNKELDRNDLGPDQIEVESLCSLVSSGTELKIFKGSFESASLDVNIKGMADESMEYPLAYGYSLVGRVVACGCNVADAESLIGRNVFTFSPHSSRVVVDRDAAQIVPDGISAEDAIFMPSVETALSLVHDAHVRLGENVAVYGQGLIGLLVTAILSTHHSSTISSTKQFCSVTAFDALDDRLAMSSNMGATSALQPQAAGIAGPFDVCIEVSGNPRALQSAIDNTSNNGRIIVGSWYGNADVALKLGIDFHRSHKTIQTSQVSTIPSTMTGLWNKNRRFALTWALVRSLKPSRLISKRMTLTDVQEAYELLDGGKEIAICFKYNK